ncbi:MAG: tRNA dihydrouridine synthase DusB [Hyphomicrobiales bacterium]
MLSIGPITLPNNVYLAPMSGVSDLPFRRLVSRFGAGGVVSEMIASEQLVKEDKEAILKIAKTGEAPHIVQLAGREASWMGIGAKHARDAGADIIDINMGCPAKKVTSGYSGSALMRDLDHAMTLIEATVEAVDCPVTLKMRLGWDDNSLNAADLAKRAENAGVQLITLHGRTRCQFYNGKADWNAIAKVKEAIDIPLIANGDVLDVTDAKEILNVTNADGVMIGRGTYGRPWLVGHAAHYLETGVTLPAPSGDALASLINEHYEALLAHYGEHIGMRAARKHLSWYLDANTIRKANTPAAERLALLTSTDIGEVLMTIKIVFSRDVPDINASELESVA